MKARTLIFGLGMLSAYPALTQTPAAANAPEPNNPTLSELEQTQLALYITQNQVLRSQQDQLDAAMIKLINQIKTEHPGFTLNPSTGRIIPMGGDKTTVNPLHPPVVVAPAKEPKAPASPK